MLFFACLNSPNGVQFARGRLSSDMSDSQRVDEFVRLLGQNQRRVFVYVLSLVPRYTDAEEIVQETNLVLWREFAKFELGTNFAAWACKVAFHQVLAWRKKQHRDRLEFSDTFLDAVAAEVAHRADELDDRADALAGCIGKLPAQQRDLLQRRYRDNASIENIAQHTARTVEAVYRALSRIRQTLHDCVTRTLAAEGHT
jgi:RNA polymerase sigma-70 factor (ECF subfamily)